MLPLKAPKISLAQNKMTQTAKSGSKPQKPKLPMNKIHKMTILGMFLNHAPANKITSGKPR